MRSEKGVGRHLREIRQRPLPPHCLSGIRKCCGYLRCWHDGVIHTVGAIGRAEPSIAAQVVGSSVYGGSGTARGQDGSHLAHGVIRSYGIGVGSGVARIRCSGVRVGGCGIGICSGGVRISDIGVRCARVVALGISVIRRCCAIRTCNSGSHSRTNHRSCHCCAGRAPTTAAVVARRSIDSDGRRRVIAIVRGRWVTVVVAGRGRSAVACIVRGTLSVGISRGGRSRTFRVIG
jgi:hypothetical protein